MGSVLLSSGSWCMQNFVYALPDWSLSFPQSSWSPIIKSCWSSWPHSLGITSLFVGSPGWEVWCGVPNLYNSVRTSLVFLFSSLSHPPRGYRIWFYHDCAPPTILLKLFLCLWTWGIFFWWVTASPVNDCSTASCSFVAFAGGNEHMSFYSTILNWNF